MQGLSNLVKTVLYSFYDRACLRTFIKCDAPVHFTLLVVIRLLSCAFAFHFKCAFAHLNTPHEFLSIYNGIVEVLEPITRICRLSFVGATL